MGQEANDATGDITRWRRELQRARRPFQLEVTVNVIGLTSPLSRAGRILVAPLPQLACQRTEILRCLLVGLADISHDLQLMLICRRYLAEKLGDRGCVDKRTKDLHC